MDAQASGLTGNVLILYNPRLTNPETLIQQLERLPLDAGVSATSPGDSSVALPANVGESTQQPAVAIAPEQRGVQPHRRFQYVTGFRRLVYRVLGWSSVGMAIVGAIMPGIPTVPFVVLAGYFFIRSSPPAHQWLLRHRWFGPMLHDWEEHRAIRRSMRNAAAGLIIVAVVIVSLLGLPLPLLVSIYSMQFIGLVIIFRLKVIPNPTPALCTRQDTPGAHQHLLDDLRLTRSLPGALGAS
jgi:uncharacterized membrane protein YbaN (DUF454 family)